MGCGASKQSATVPTYYKTFTKPLAENNRSELSISSGSVPVIVIQEPHEEVKVSVYKRRIL